MSRLRHGLPLWLDRRPSSQKKFPRHKGSLVTDVVIIGGGVTGAIAAYLFSDAGVRVVLLEAKDIARGSTAASTALLMQEPDRDFEELAERYGHRTAQRIWRALGGATHGLADAIRKLKLKCDLHRRDSVYFTLNPDEIDALRAEFESRKRAGLPGRWLTPKALYRKTGVRGQAGISTPGNAEVDPIGACHGFLKAARARGARIFERSPARRVKTTDDGVSVQTPGGIVHARYVLVATGYATPEFKPLTGRFQMRDTYVIATRRLPQRLRRRVSRSHAMLWDTDRPYHYLRWTTDGRALVGGGDRIHRSKKGSRTRIARAKEQLWAFLTLIHPELTTERPEFAWEGLFAQTPDGLPYIGTHARYPKHLFALGYGGNGMTASFLAAQLLLRRYQGKPAAAEALFAFNRMR
jgi:glycine/D-amino acid oxidase-like deaminating enzyme